MPNTKIKPIPDGRRQRTRLSPDQRASQLLDTALELFAKKGVGRVGHGDIAKAAHVSTGTVFNYFPTIEGLNAVVMKEVSRETLSIFADDIPPDSSSPVLIYGERLLALVVKNPNLLKIFLNWSHAFSEPYRSSFLALKGEIISQVSQSLPKREESGIDAQIIFGTGVLFAQMKLEGASEDDLNRFAARVAQLIGQ
ncbi:MAG: TetR/AcrR family transcriptional regulator [Maricaulaceae bacterium]